MQRSLVKRGSANRNQSRHAMHHPCAHSTTTSQRITYPRSAHHKLRLVVPVQNFRRECPTGTLYHASNGQVACLSMLPLQLFCSQLCQSHVRLFLSPSFPRCACISVSYMHACMHQYVATTTDLFCLSLMTAQMFQLIRTGETVHPCIKEQLVSKRKSVARAGQTHTSCLQRCRCELIPHCGLRSTHYSHQQWIVPLRHAPPWQQRRLEVQ